MINNTLHILLLYCTWGRLSRGSGRWCRVRPRGTWRTDRTPRTRWGPSRRRWSHPPLCPCRPTSTIHKPKASRTLQVVDHNSRWGRTCICHVFSFPDSPHSCVSVWWRLAEMREREVRETHCLVSSSHRTPDNLHSAKNNTARLHKILMREFKLNQQYELVYSQSGKNQYQFLICFVVSANKVLLITQIWKVSKVGHCKKLTEYRLYLTLFVRMLKWANLQSKQSKASQIKLAEESLKGFETDYINIVTWYREVLLLTVVIV